jgi:soluble lytic murein transglycosylase-like protein
VSCDLKIVRKFEILILAMGLLSMPALAADPPSAAPHSTAHLGAYAVLSNGFSIRHLRRETIGDTTRLYLSMDPKAGYVDVPSASVVRFEQEEVAPPAPVETQTRPSAPPAPTLRDTVERAGSRQQIDPDFIASVIHAESGGNARAVSPKGARGLMQLMPQTAVKLGVEDSFDPVANVDAGARYLRQLLDQYHGDTVRALAAYNAGSQRVDQYRGVPPYRETRAYVSRIIRDYNKKKLAQDPSLAKKR